ncbi:contractile injection system tape measure protein [Flammeovirgaceae bacterium SG7u.111]|nr:contractile injection system tape measure protein [Flammeovirgaceae bacterium SG7u.132]WPO36489.1 contractile injection system tape measure protein [Flammeovirgaceae bacterium SG7u.111]
MSAEQKHIIRRQVFDLKLPKQEGAFQLQEEVKELFYEQISPMLEKLFSEIAPADKVLSIDNLTLDLGKIPLAQLQESLLKRIETEFRERVKTEVGGRLSVAKRSREKDRDDAFLEREKSRSNWEVFLYFLAMGNMPWNSTLGSISALEKEIQVFLEDKNVFPEQLKTELARHLAEKKILIRLVSQFSNHFLATVMDRLLGKEINELRSLYLLVEKQAEDFGLGRREQQELRQVYWFVSLEKAVRQPSVKSIELIKSALEAVVLYFSNITQKNKQAVCEELDKQLLILQKSKSISNLPVASSRKVLEELKKEWAKREGKGSEVKGNPIQHLTEKKPFQKDKEDQVKSSGKGISQKKSGNPTQNEDSFKSTNPSFSLDKTAGKSEKKALGGLADKTRENDLSAKAKEEKAEKSKDQFQHRVLQNEQEGVYIKNAGLVLLAPFIPTLFGKLGFVSEKAISHKDKAVHLLQYLVSGASQTDESELTLNKLLCGISLSEPIAQEAFFHPEELAEADGMLEAVIEHWKALKGTSIQGLQETFLQRDGKLSRTADKKWLLQVEQKAYDILLAQLPWGYSMVKLSWMEDVLTVEWA